MPGSRTRAAADPGRIRLASYDIGYVDLLTLCPQWHELFVRRALDVRLSRPDARILDCGANIGLASLFFKSLYPRARISAYEADPSVAEVLADNLQRNGCADVEVIPAAVWTHNGSVVFRAEGADAGSIDQVAGPRIAGPTAAVTSVRLRDDIASHPIDLLKLDIEGAEADVLADCLPVLDRVSAIVVEVHEFDLARRRLPDVLRVLGEAGYTWSIDGLVQLPWMAPRAASTPFAHVTPAWVALVHAWRPSEAAS